MKETAPLGHKYPREDKEIFPGFGLKPTTDPRSESQNPKYFQIIDPLKLTPLSTLELGSESLEDMMSLSE